jgi:S1-C subfamily serine protease
MRPVRPLLTLLLFALPALAADPAPCVKVQRETGKPYDVTFGSGAVVRSDKGVSLVLTCWHCAPDGKQPMAVLAGGWIGTRKYPAEFVAADDRIDLALLRVKATLPVVAVADAEPAPGSVVWVHGYPGGGNYGGSCGRVLDQKSRATVRTPFGLVSTADNLIADCLITFGCSGGPVMDTDGKVCGVVYMGPNGLKHPGQWDKPATCVRLADVRRFVGQYVK